MELKELKALVKMITETDISEFELRNGEEKVLIRRGRSFDVMSVSAPVAHQTVLPPAANQSAPAAPVVTGATTKDEDVIPSPMVGTFYRKPSPDADTFVEVGSVVEKGQTLCLIEAMKLFNEIEAEFKCRILEILKDDTTPVEFGEPLFKVERLG
jgi:acetyl-CoA carboxylase biotin carboxyl carrier protein